MSKIIVANNVGLTSEQASVHPLSAFPVVQVQLKVTSATANALTQSIAKYGFNSVTVLSATYVKGVAANGTASAPGAVTVTGLIATADKNNVFVNLAGTGLDTTTGFVNVLLAAG